MVQKFQNVASSLECHVCPGNTGFHAADAACRRQVSAARLKGGKCLNASEFMLHSSAEPTLRPNVKSNVKPQGCLGEQTHTSETETVITSPLNVLVHGAKDAGSQVSLAFFASSTTA